MSLTRLPFISLSLLRSVQFEQLSWDDISVIFFFFFFTNALCRRGSVGVAQHWVEGAGKVVSHGAALFRGRHGDQAGQQEQQQQQEVQGEGRSEETEEERPRLG